MSTDSELTFENKIKQQITPVHACWKVRLFQHSVYIVKKISPLKPLKINIFQIWQIAILSLA